MKDMLTRSLNDRDFQHSASHSYNDYEQFEELQETIENLTSYSMKKFRLKVIKAENHYKTSVM